jgi:membrane protease YdiL (CAAX protease family)
MLWGPWHLPVLLQRDVVEIVLFLLAVFALSFILTWLFNGAQGSLIPALLFHAAQNSAGTVESFFPALEGSSGELISVLVLLIVGVAAGVSMRTIGPPASNAQAALRSPQSP